MTPALARPRAALLPLLLALLWLGGCAAPPRAVGQDLDADRALAAERQGNYLVAAREYQRLAERSEPPRRQQFELKRAELLIKAAQTREARTVLQGIEVRGLDAGFHSRKLLLEAALASSEGRPDLALERLTEAERDRNLDPQLYADLLEARARNELALDRPFDAVHSLVRRDRYLARRADTEANQQQIWQILEGRSRPELNRELGGRRDPAFAGWIDLALRMLDPGPSPAAAIDAWRRNHPAHPASDLLLKTLASPTAALRLPTRVARIALLLPLSSEHAQAAQAVRDGFLAMNNAAQGYDKPEVRVYDIGADPALAAAAYDRAVAEGAQFVVGPLGLDAVEQVARRGLFTVPTLLLSHTTQDLARSAGHVFQFGLPPEQEAEQAAERAYLDGRRRAAVLTPSNAWGQRMAAAFTAAWERLGGLTVSLQTYLPDQAEYSAPVRRLLNIQLSEARKEALEARLKTRLKYEARPREDIDFIFLAADPRHARLIKPQINYHRASRLPVYATSHVFDGRGDPVSDADLDGVLFGDMPWLLASDERLEKLRTNVQGAWPYARSTLDRLYALGLDAYALIPQLTRLTADPAARLLGVTSGLSLDRDGRLRRQLLWARFRQGLPQLVDTFLQYKGQYQTTDDGTEETLDPGTGP